MNRGTASTIGALIARMPQVFANPNIPDPHGTTTYLGALGKECIFDGSAKGVKIQQITDGTSKTIMLVEADPNQAVVWTKPDDWKFDAKNPKAGLGNMHPGGWLAAFADGSTRFISNMTDPRAQRDVHEKWWRSG